MNHKVRSFATLVFETPADGLILCDASLQICLADHRASAFFGLATERFSGRALIEFFLLDERKVVDALSADLKPLRILNVPIRTLEATPYTVDVTFQLLSALEPGGDVLFSFRKRVPPMVNRFLESAIHRMPFGIFQATPSMQIGFANEAMCRMFRYDSPEEMRRLSIGQLFAGDDVHLFLNPQLRHSDRVQGRRALMKRSDGTNFWAHLHCFEDAHGADVSFVGMITDVTETVENEHRLAEKNNTLYRTSWELDTLIYQVSHDLRSPISSMDGLINLIRLEGIEHRYVTMLAECLSRLNSFISQLTSFSKNVRQRVKDERVDFKAIVSSILSDLNTHRNFNFIDISLDLNLDCPFFSDAFRVNLLLSTVLKNAYDFHDITKSMRIVTVSVVTSSERAVIRIFDNGRGIPKAHIDRVFDMFFRASDAAKGSGIGLYIAKEAVRVLGGTISLKSEFGIGTSVQIELPNSDKGRLIGLKRARRQTIRTNVQAL